MFKLSRREFLTCTVFGLAGLCLPSRLHPFILENSVQLPDVSSLDDPCLIRIVDREHPISKEEIHLQIEPHLVAIKMSAEGILAANEHVRVHKLCHPALEALFSDSDAARTGLYIHSGFRSYEEQAYTYSKSTDKSLVLKPGESQHHTGLAVDFTSSEIGKIIDKYSGFERTKAGGWIHAHAWEYGFVQSYTSGHDQISPEPWHYLYIGKQLAAAYRDLLQYGWYGDVFLLQSAMNLGMHQIVIPSSESSFFQYGRVG